jgi:hypothetical protein
MKLQYARLKGHGRRKKGRIRWVDPQGGYHVARTFFGVTTFDRYSWCSHRKRWISYDEDKPGNSSHTHGIRSVKAFQRRLKQWSTYLPAGVEFILCSRFDELCGKGKTQ